MDQGLQDVEHRVSKLKESHTVRVPIKDVFARWAGTSHFAAYSLQKTSKNTDMNSTKIKLFT